MDKKGEALAKTAFAEFLRHRYAKGVAWRRGNEPPDYSLRIGDASFAVEVTRVMEATTHGGVTLPAHGWRAALERFVADIEDGAIRAGILHGSYGMTVAPIPNFNTRREELVRAALEYISATQQVEQARTHPIVKLGSGRTLTIAKAGVTRNQVAAVILVGKPKWGTEAGQDLTILLKERIAEKQRRLRRLRRPRILLLIDSYIYSESDDWAAAAASIDASGFHTVARITDRTCQILYSVNRGWRRAA